MIKYLSQCFLNYAILIFFGIVLLIIPPGFATAKTPQKFHLLVLNSYEKGFPWTDNIVKGIGSTLKNGQTDVELKIEYMDSKAIKYDPAYKKRLHDLYSYKYKNFKFDVIITSDDNALNFVREFHDDIFSGTKVVFCGVNNLKAPDLVDRKRFTGILEITSEKETIELARKLNPKMKRVVIIVDTTPSGNYRWKQLELIFPYFPELEFIRFDDRYYLSEIEEKMKNLDEDTIAFFAALYRDKSGRFISLSEGVQRISNASKQPIYTYHLQVLEYGTIGGKLLGGAHHGQKAAEMALRIIQGEKVQNIPIAKNSLAKYIFDYHQLKRFKIKPSNLPRNSHIVNKPSSLYETYKAVVWQLASVVIFLLAFILVLLMNIRKRKLSEKALQASDNKYHSLFSSVNEGVCLHSVIYDQQGQAIDYRILEMNPAYEMILNIKSEDAVNRLASQLYGTNTPPYMDIFLKVVETGKPVSFEAFFPPMEKHFKISVFSPGAGQFATLFADITEQKMAENSLKEREEQYRAVVDNIGDYIMRYDKNFRHIYANRLALDATGLPIDQYIGKTHREMGFPDHLCELWKKNIKLVFDTGKQQNIEFDIELAEAAMSMELQLNPEFAIDGSVQTVIGISRDVTSRRQAEAEKKKLESRLQQAQKMESIGTLAGGIAHDFNNILSSVIGYTELALNGAEKGTELKDDLQEVRIAGLRAKDLVKQILTFARQSDEAVQPIQVSNIAKEVIKFIRSSIPTTIQINDNLNSDSLMMGSPTQVHQIFMNLFTNSAHAMEKNGGILDVSVNEITIDRKALPDLKPGEYIEIKVTDTGMGISPQHIRTIFEPYFTTKAVGEGTGMGLAVVHGIVKNYGGHITVDSTIGKGTCFTIYLPITKKRKIHSHTEKKDLPIGTENILFVDDEASIAKMGSKALDQLGYTVTARTSSVEALELFKSEPQAFDLVVTDMTMPNMTGDTMAKEMMNIRSNIPVILCTGYSKKISEESAADIGIKALAYKPIVKADLAKTVRKVLDEAKSSS